MKTLMILASVLFFNLSISAQAQTFASDTPGCDFYFQKQNLCATLGWDSSGTANQEGTFFLSFWNHDQGSAQQPVHVDPDADVVTLEVKKAVSGASVSKVYLEHVQTEDGYDLDGEFNAPVQLGGNGAYKITVELKGLHGTVYDTAETAFTTP